MNFSAFLAANMEKNIWRDDENRLRSAFRVFDVMNTGKITLEDLKTLFGSLLNIITFFFINIRT